MLNKYGVKFDKKHLSREDLKSFYSALLKPRMIEEKMMLQLRQGKISKWFSAYGQEATSVGATLAMNDDEYILPMHRNLGMFTTRGISLERLFGQYQAKKTGFTKGRDRSHHFGVPELNIVGMISHLGPQLSIANGIALADLLEEAPKVTLVVSGDGGASEGDFHEALNVASVWNLPVIFLIENNQWGLSTPSNEQFKFKSFVDKGVGYGMKAVQCDGNNLLDVYHTVKKAADEARLNPAPVIVECMTFRIRGHEEASGTKYYPEGLIEKWQGKDPVLNFEKFLLDEQIIDQAEIERIKLSLRLEINKAADSALNAEEVEVNTQIELDDVYAPHRHLPTEGGIKEEMRFIDAVSLGLKQAMEKHPGLILMGQDIAEYGGAFKVTQGLVDEFGKSRVRNTPLCESAIIGAGLGLSVKGKKAMIEMQFADFVTCGFNQIINNLAKIHWRWGQNADIVVRMPTGAGVAAGPFHSQSNEAWFYHTPGLKIFYPAFPDEAKSLLLEAFEDPNPVLFFEHKNLYRSLSGPVDTTYHTLESGKASIVQAGTDATIITYGMGVHWAIDATKEFQGSIEIINLRTLSPLDWDTVFESVKKTGRALVLDEANFTGGVGADISARISDVCFEFLDAPVKRVASLDTPIPFSAKLEANFLPKSRLASVLQDLLKY